MKLFSMKSSWKFGLMSKDVAIAIVIKIVSMSLSYSKQFSCIEEMIVNNKITFIHK